MKPFILLSCWIAAASAVAQPAARPVTLAETLDLALANSAQIKKARLDRQGLELKIREGRSALFPQINAVAGLDYYPVLPTNFLPADLFGGPDGAYVPATFGQPWQLGGTLRVEQQLYNESGRRMAPAANISRAIYDLLGTRAEEDVLYNTAAVFYQTLQTEQLLRSANANLEKLEALQRTTELQLANGYAIPTDVKRVQVARTNLEAQRHHLVNGIKALHQTLQFLCGIPFEEAIDPVEDTASPAADSARWQALGLDVEAATEYRLLQRQLELNRVETRALHGAAFPQLSAYAVAGFQTQNANVNFFESGQRWYGLGAVGFKLNVPVFDGFQRRRKAAQLAVAALKTEEDSRQLRQAKQLEYYKARDQFQGA